MAVLKISYSDISLQSTWQYTYRIEAAVTGYANKEKNGLITLKKEKETTERGYTPLLLVFVIKKNVCLRIELTELILFDAFILMWIVLRMWEGIT